MLKQEAQRAAICGFLRAADISIADIEVVTKQEVDEVKFHHVTEQGKAVFDLIWGAARLHHARHLAA